MKRLLLASLAVLSACGGENTGPAEPQSTYNIDIDRLTVSGASSGAMMATQIHVAHSRLFSGAALLAGGPYYCSEASLSKGLGACMNGGDLNVPALLEYARAASAAATIDPIENIADDRIWVVHGSEDRIIHPDLPAATIEFYESLGVSALQFVSEIPVTHGIPTIDTGAPCADMVSPFLNACDYDAAGELLATVNGAMQARSESVSALELIAQPGAEDATMLPEAFLYVPASCRNGQVCGLHVAFHGCKQSSKYVGDAFAKGAGYNEWAESNNLLVLYPQVDSSKIAPMNPMGCWDWWGYTDDEYSTRAGPQIAVVKATMDRLAGKTL